MSGGSLEYGYSKINQVIESIQDALNERELNEATKSRMLTLIESLEKASNNAYLLEWYLSADISEEQMERDWRAE